MAVGRLLAGEPDMTLHCCHKAADALAHANQLAPTVILQDLHMPEIDGPTLVGRFRSNPATATTPIIVLSGNDDAPTRAQAAASGANDYLVKLPNKETLIACIRRHADAPSDAQASEAAPAAAAAGASPTFDRTFIVEISDGLEDPRAFIVTLIDQYLGDAATLVDTLNQAAGPWDVPVLKMAAHTLKGSSLMIGASRLGALCAQVEEHLGRQPGDMVKALLIRALNEEFVRVRSACLLERDGVTPSADQRFSFMKNNKAEAQLLRTRARRLAQEGTL
jgi:CheY-like chemotaxis protein/HPt (histidine-containing phosphotransfer) domain-containing protein